MRGGAINGVLGELLGHRCGMSHGKGSSMHIFTPAFFGGNGIVGAFQWVLALRLLRSTVVKNIVCLHCTGDGANNQGQVFKSFNMVRSIRHLFFLYMLNMSVISGQTLEPSLSAFLPESASGLEEK